MTQLNHKKIFIKSYGCQMNVYDSDRIKNLFEPKGYLQTSKVEDADLVVLNTCHIREKAAEKVYSDIGRIEKVFSKNKKNDYKLVVAGCVAQAEGIEIKKRAPRVDYVVGPQSYQNLPEMINKNEEFISDDFLQNEKFKSLIFKSSNIVSEFISIQEGCDKFCSFCVVPYTRGSEFSRPVKEIKDEIKQYTDNGIQEVILLGQNVNAYHGQSNNKDVDLAYLLESISELEQIKRIRYMTSHPNDMADSLIDAHVSNKKLMPFIHLPVQSGSDNILKKMNRKHTRNKYLEIVNKLKSKRPDIAMSSDFIVGFPGETDDDFDLTMNLIKEVEFSIAYSFMFSPRPGTPAHKLTDINKSIKKARLSALQSLLKEQQKNFNLSFVGKKIEVLFDRKGRNQNQYIGRSIYNQSVFITSNENLIGKILQVPIIRSTDFALEAKK
ncbi:tRNA (N6-isopentenyl adenosine(37)-C2)-methylthiotransferase MiaB [Alphaproteobacteria bacterium]|nr:tRNA (N6-isopentenyl adenosine(37)-C2)-methylthiotransferase MiaB [Alphaproteobacteria bacterium]